MNGQVSNIEMLAYCMQNVEWTIGRMDEWIKECMDDRTDGQLDKWTNG